MGKNHLGPTPHFIFISTRGAKRGSVRWHAASFVASASSIQVVCFARPFDCLPRYIGHPFVRLVDKDIHPYSFDIRQSGETHCPVFFSDRTQPAMTAASSKSASFPGRSRRFHRLSGTVNVGLLAFLALTSSSSSSSTGSATGTGHLSLGLGLGLVHAAAVEMTHEDTASAADKTCQDLDLLHPDQRHQQHPDERHLQRGGGGGGNNKKNPPSTPAPVSGPPPTMPAPVANPTTPAPVAAPTTPAPVEPPTDQCYACTSGTNAGQSCAGPPGATSDCGTVGTTTTVTCSKSPFGVCTTDADCGGKGSKCNVVTQTPTHGQCSEAPCTEAPTGMPTESPTKGPTGAPTTDAPSARPSKGPTGELLEMLFLHAMHAYVFIWNS